MLNPVMYIDLAVGESKNITISGQRIFLYSDNYAHAGLIDLSWAHARVLDDGGIINKSNGIAITSNANTTKTFTNNTGKVIQISLY